MRKRLYHCDLWLAAAALCAVLALALLPGCSGGNGTSIFSLPGTAFVGHYTGTMSGAATGTMSFDVNANGGISATVSSTTLRAVYTGTGSVDADGHFTITLRIGQHTVTFTGALTSQNGIFTFSGTWRSTSGQSGAFSGQEQTTTPTPVPTGGPTPVPTARPTPGPTPRPTATPPGGLAQFAGTYNGTYSGSTSGTFTAVVTSTGTITATAHDVSGGSDSATGTVSSTGTITFGSVSSGASFTGTFHNSGGVEIMSGTWTNPRIGANFGGTWTGRRA